MSSNNTTSLSLETISVNTIRGYIVAQLVFVVSCSLNAVCCLMSSLTLWRGKFFTGRMFVLLRIFFLNDGLTSLFVCSLQLWHISNNLNSVPELFSRSTCFWINGLQFFLVISNVLISMMVALDRLQFSLNPTKVIPKYFEPSCFSWSMLIVPFVLSGVLYILSLLDNGGGETVLLYCTARNSTGPKTTVLLWSSIFLFSIGTMLLYVFMLMVACCRKTKVGPVSCHQWKYNESTRKERCRDTSEDVQETQPQLGHHDHRLFFRGTTSKRTVDGVCNPNARYAALGGHILWLADICRGFGVHGHSPFVKSVSSRVCQIVWCQTCTVNSLKSDFRSRLVDFYP